MKKYFKYTLLTLVALVLMYTLTWGAATFSIRAAINLLSNPGFEGSASPWSLYCGTWESANGRSGSGDVRLDHDSCGVYITKTGLTASTTYTLRGYLKAADASQWSHFYAQNFGGSAVSAETNSTSYTLMCTTFTTGPSNTSAEIGVWRDAGDGTGYTYADDFELLVGSLCSDPANLLSNPGFEGSASPWSLYCGAWDATNPHIGGGDARLDHDSCGVYITQTGLTASTTYTLRGYLKAADASQWSHFYAQNYGGSAVSSETNSTSYVLSCMTFTTGSSNTSAEIGVWRDAGDGTGYTYADDFELLAGSLCGGSTATPTNTPVSSPTATPHSAATFYVSPSGNDNNTGTSQAQAWKTAARVNSSSFVANDHILFEGGQTFAGPVVLGTDDNGASGSPIVISSYGTGRATINAGGGSDAAGSSIVVGSGLGGSQWVTVNNINVTGPGRTTNNQGVGVYIVKSQNIVVDHVDASGFQKAGVYLYESSHVDVTYVNASYNGLAGIMSNGWRATGEEVVSDDIYVGYSTTNHNDGDPTITNNWSGSGIVFGGVKNSTIEYSLAAYNGCCMPWNGNGPVGIWVYSSDNITVQYNISHDNTSPGYDGGGYDIDGGTRNSTFQYNYSYNNHGAGYLGWSSSGQNPPTGGWETYPYTNNVFRYNISKNDGAGDHGAGIRVFDAAGPGMSVYGNTVVESGGSLGGLGGSPAKNYNNVYYANSGSGKDANGNWYVAYGQSPSPLLVNPGITDSLEDPTQFSTLTAYKLQSGSPCINNGVDLASKGISSPGTHDFWGNTIPNGVYDIGAHEYPNAPTSTPTRTPTRTSTPTPTRTSTSTPTRTATPSNLIQNPGFETGALSPWWTWGTGSVLNSNAHSGTYSTRLSGSNSGVQQDNIPVSPNTTYILTGWLKVSASGNTVNLGVKNYGGTEQVVAVTSTTYQQKTITFTTGATNTTATIYCWKSAGSNYSYCDDFSVIRQ